MKRRNEILDNIKLIAACSVVFLHFPLPGEIGSVVFAIVRYAVPLFFAISGYFYSKENKEIQFKGTKRKVKHIAILLLVSELLGFVYNLFRYIVNEKQLNFECFVGFLTESVDAYKAEAWRLISFTPLFNYTSWFLVQLLFSYIIFAVITKYSLFNKAKWFLILTFTIGFLTPRLSYALNIILPPYLDYFILFMGLPFFGLGYYLKEFFQKHSIADKLSNKLIIGSIILECILTCVEAYFVSGVALFVGSILIVFSLFCFFVKNSDYSMKTGLGKWCSFSGAELSLYVYILHPFVGPYVRYVLKKLPIISLNDTVTGYLTPILICICAVLFSAVIYYVLGFIKMKYILPEVNYK